VWAVLLQFLLFKGAQAGASQQATCNMSCTASGGNSESIISATADEFNVVGDEMTMKSKPWEVSSLSNTDTKHVRLDPTPLPSGSRDVLEGYSPFSCSVTAVSSGEIHPNEYRSGSSELSQASADNTNRVTNASPSLGWTANEPGWGRWRVFTVTEELDTPILVSVGTKVSVKVYHTPTLKRFAGRVKSVLKTMLTINGNITYSDKERASLDRSIVGTPSRDHTATPGTEVLTVACKLSWLSTLKLLTVSVATSGATAGITVMSTATTPARASLAFVDVTVRVTRS
jgi:hypothetical protein